MAQAHLTNLNSANNDGLNLQINGNGKDRGGTCSGDSGGPIFLGGYTSNVIVAVNSFGITSGAGHRLRLPHRHGSGHRLDS